MIKAKRFWKEVQIVTSTAGYEIHLDGRGVMTPLKSKLCVPTLALAELIAQEWRAVEGVIKPSNMPMTRRANSAIERIAQQRGEIEDHLTDYVMTDLICYRASSPIELHERQKVWDEWINWALEREIELITSEGVMPVAQNPNNRSIAKIWLQNWSDFELTSVYDFITLTGSFVLGMAIAEGVLDIDTGFELSQIDEDYQESVWGADEEALENSARKRLEVETSHRFFMTLRHLI